MDAPTSSDFAHKYRAISSRDSRFDGQFITGVHSTGIYCRPSCPARTPLERNVSFYRTAAAAHEAGLRACKRCTPDAVPGSPDWNTRDDLASRAMRLITDGVVERTGVGGLAARLGYTARHLTRVLNAELGAGPLALARAHRAHTARLLLVSTTMPMSDVAFAAGFSSIRQFNDTVHAIYELTPTDIRRQATSTSTTSTNRSHSHSPSTADGLNAPITVSLLLPARAPFDGQGLFTFFAEHAVLGIESGDSTHYSRRIRLPHGNALLSISLDGESAVRVTATIDNLADVGTLVTRVRRLLDLDADSSAIDSALAADVTLAPLIERTPGIRIPGSLDAEEALFRALIGQQISVAAARTVLARITQEIGIDGQFPTAAAFAEKGREYLRGPSARVDAIIGAAHALVDGRLSLDLAAPREEFTAGLTGMAGIGQWTADYLALRVLGHPDVLLSTDLVIRSSARGLGLPATARELDHHGLLWAPWRSYAGMHLWRAR
ncbi:MAG: AlkA N-terminal domain-containing protein [Microbacteriaceae bacterium]